MSSLERTLAEQWPDGTFGGHPAAPKPARSTCAWCGHNRALTTDGVFWSHRNADNPCAGNGRRPLTHPATAARHRAQLLAALTGTDRQQPIPARPRKAHR